MRNEAYPLYEVRKLTTLTDMIEQSVSLYGDKNAFLVKRAKGEPYTGVTFLQLDKDMKALGTMFLSLGLDGKKIAVIGENRYEWAIAYLAAVNGQSVVVPIDRELPTEDVANLLKTAGASCVVYSKKHSAAMRELKDKISELELLVNMDLQEDTAEERSFFRLVEEGGRLFDTGDRSFEEGTINPEEARILLFTSGTTSFPKGVLLSHKNIVTDLMSMCQMLYIDEKDVFLSVLPLHHTYECTCGFLCALYRGSTVAYAEGLKYILPNLKEAKATMMLGVPALFENMYRRIWNAARKNGLDKKINTGLKISGLLRKLHIDMRRKLFAQIHETLGGNLRMFVSGAAAIDPLVAKGFQDFGISFFQGYGITECSPIVALNRDRQFLNDAAGLAMPCMEVKIIDRSADGVGEIVCRGENVMLGYYKDESATQEAFEGGWFHTGDLGYQDKEGFFHITGRKKNVIVLKNGKNIFPEELETLLNRNPFVLESMIVGEFNPQDGETTLCAQIVPDLAYVLETLGENADAQALQKAAEDVVKEVNRRNPHYKYIKRCVVRENEFIKTTTKKIKRYMEQPLKK